MGFDQVVVQACDANGLIGSELRAHLARELPAKVLLRKAKDVVLLTGATGAGKEKVAEVAHEAARAALGRRGELIRVNCANLTGGLFESELFGHKRGAFTGADRDYTGLIRKAQGGSLLLDEVQALEPQHQARLLRFLGERECRAVGDDRATTSDALLMLASNQDLGGLVREGKFRRDLLDRATAKVQLPALWERRQDVGELAQSFAMEAGRDLGSEDFMGLTRRARADIEAAVVRAREVSVRRLRELVRDAVFSAAADTLPDALESDFLLPLLERELGFAEADRDTADRDELVRDFELLVGRTQLKQLVSRHSVSPAALKQLVRAMHQVIGEMADQPRTYRNVVERTNRLTKVALWLVSGARTQADFRRFFGTLEADMPTKSVAHQVYYDVFTKDEDATPWKKGGPR